SLFPQAEGTAIVRFAPPIGVAIAPGPTPFAVKVTAATDADDTTVEEGSINVGRVDDISAELLPLSSKGRRATRHRIAIDSRGNAPIDVALQATDPAE